MKKSNNLWIVLVLVTLIFGSCAKETTIEPKEVDAIEQLAIDMITFFPKENTPEQNDLIVKDVNERYAALNEEELMQYLAYKRDAQIRNSGNFEDPEAQIAFAHDSYEYDTKVHKFLKEKLGKALNKVTIEEYQSLVLDVKEDTEIVDYAGDTEAAEERSSCTIYDFYRKVRLINYNYGSAGNYATHTNIGDKDDGDCDDQFIKWNWAFNSIFCFNTNTYNWIKNKAATDNITYAGSTYRVAAVHRVCNQNTKLFLPVGWFQHSHSTLTGIFNCTSQQITTVSNPTHFHWGCYN